MWHYFWQVSTHSESSCKSSKERRPIVRCIARSVEQRRSLVGPACRTAGSFQGHLGLTTSLKLGAPPSFSGRPFHAREPFFQPSSLARARCPLPRFVDIGRIFCHRQKGVFTPNLASLFPFITGIICWDPILRRAAYSQISFNGAPTGFPFTSPTASQSRNFPQRTLFPSHSTWFTSSCIAQHYQPQAPQSHCSTSAAPTLCRLAFLSPKPFFWGAAPTVVRPLYTLAGTRQLQRGGRPHRGSLVGSSSGAYHRLRKKARLSATMSHNVHRLSTFRWGQKPPKRILGSSRSFSFYQFSFWENFYWDSCPLHILSLAI